MDDLSGEKLICHRAYFANQSIGLMLAGKSQGVGRRVDLRAGPASRFLITNFLLCQLAWWR